MCSSKLDLSKGSRFRPQLQKFFYTTAEIQFLFAHTLLYFAQCKGSRKNVEKEEKDLYRKSEKPDCLTLYPKKSPNKIINQLR